MHWYCIVRLIPSGTALHSAAKWLLDCFLMFASYIPGFCIILYPFGCLCFTKSAAGFNSVSFDKVWKEKNMLVVILFPCLFFWCFGFLLETDWCLQAILWILRVAWILRSTQTSLHHPLSAVFTSGKWHLSSQTHTKFT